MAILEGGGGGDGRAFLVEGLAGNNGAGGAFGEDEREGLGHVGRCVLGMDCPGVSYEVEEKETSRKNVEM